MISIQETNWEEYRNSITVKREDKNGRSEIELTVEEPAGDPCTVTIEADINLDDQEHHTIRHIDLNKEQTIILRDFLNKCIENKAWQ